MPSFSADAVISYGFVDDKDDVHFFGITEYQEIVTDFTLFTTDPTDPPETESGDHTGWIGLDVAETGIVRLYTSLEAGDSMSDTQLAIWGPRSTPPGVSTDPWHYGDDNFPSGYLTSLHSSGSDPSGTDYISGYRHSEDESAVGLTLPPGKYWVALWPFSWVDDEPRARLVIEPLKGFVADAIIKGPRSASFSADAIIGARYFTADAWIVAERWTHDRVRDHHGAESDLNVVLEADIGPYAAYTPIHYVFEGLHDRLVQLESSNRVRSSFTADAVISGNAILADAIIHKPDVTASFTADAVLIRGGSFTADAWIQAGFTADAFIVAAL